MALWIYASMQYAEHSKAQAKLLSCRRWYPRCVHCVVKRVQSGCDLTMVLMRERERVAGKLLPMNSLVCMFDPCGSNLAE